MIWITTLILLTLVVTCTDGFPGGAGGCGPYPSIGAPHFDTSNGKIVTELPFATGPKALSLIVGGSPHAISGTTTVKVGAITDMNIIGTGIKGVLFRLSAIPDVNLSGVPVPGAGAAIASACTLPLIGITHTNNIEKTSIGGTVQFKQATNITVDLTVVFSNNATTSQYTGGKFYIRVCKQRRCNWFTWLFCGCRPRCVFV
jgi:hypothetical protein